MPTRAIMLVLIIILSILLFPLSIYLNGWTWRLVLTTIFSEPPANIHRISWMPALPSLALGLLTLPFLATQAIDGSPTGFGLLVNVVSFVAPPVALHFLVPNGEGAQISLRTAFLSYLTLLAAAICLGLLILVVVVATFATVA